MYVEIGKHLKDIRIEKGIKRYELSEKSGISTTQITNIEKGRMKPTVVTLKKLVDVLECDFDYFYKKYFE